MSDDGIFPSTFPYRFTQLQVPSRVTEFINGRQLYIYLVGIDRRKEQNLLLTAGFAVSKVSFVHMLVDRQEGLRQQREGTVQSSSPFGC